MELLLCASPQAQSQIDMGEGVLFLFRYGKVNNAMTAVAKIVVTHGSQEEGHAAPLGATRGSIWAGQEAEREGEVWARALNVTPAGKEG